MDIWFGTGLAQFGVSQFEVVDYGFFTFDRNTAEDVGDDERNLMTMRAQQSTYVVKTTQRVDYIYRIISLIGGCWCMLTGVSTWLLKNYIGFQMNKSAVKKLYSYSRVKQSKVKKDDA